MAIENIKEIETALGIEEGKLSEILTSEEKHTIDLSERIIEPKSIYEERIGNIKRDHFKQGQDLMFKSVRETFGLDITGKNTENLIAGLKMHIETEKEKGGAEPEEKYTKLKADFEKLQGNFTAKENEFVKFKEEISKQNEANEIKSEFSKYVPDNTLVSKSTIFVEAKEKGYSLEKEEGKIVVKLNGEVQKDEKTLSPISVESFVKNFVTPYIGKPAGGSGKGDETPPSQAGSFDAFEKEAKKAGWSSEQINVEMQKRIKEGTLKL